MKTSREVEVKIFKEKLHDKEGKGLFRKTKKILIKIYNVHHIYCLTYCLANLFLGLLEKPKCQIVYFFSGPNIVETAMEAFPPLVMYLYSEGGLDLFLTH